MLDSQRLYLKTAIKNSIFPKIMCKKETNGEQVKHKKGKPDAPLGIVGKDGLT